MVLQNSGNQISFTHMLPCLCPLFLPLLLWDAAITKPLNYNIVVVSGDPSIFGAQGEIMQDASALPLPLLQEHTAQLTVN